MIDQAEFGLAGNLAFVFAGIGAAHCPQVQRPNVGIGRVVHLESAVAYERVRIDRQQMAVSLANPRDLQRVPRAERERERAGPINLPGVQRLGLTEDNKNKRWETAGNKRTDLLATSWTRQTRWACAPYWVVTLSGRDASNDGMLPPVPSCLPS